ncbi:hypothetical protein J4E70_02840 [Pseudohalocynthiibacter aestuariivivens]|uniref:hypothetical protein n=1 Tax=Pseudohalocynthiibacter sp. F2068 TaxID=2926418 RepID=UPI001BD240E0|nr:hypothetical protein [Pseudohalocynthiibacter aestuariivivens]MCK0101488.1 DUF2927 domain-containing protein [Pseudohalocynthiibacter sp. F2068]
MLTPDQVEALFTRADGSYVFARWGRPIVPIVFGVDDATLSVLKGAIEAVVTLANHKMAETDPELGANLMVFFVQDWAELVETSNIDQLIPDLAAVVERLQAAKATQYRAFRFDEAGAIQACFSFVRMDNAMAVLPAETIALSLAVQAILLWSDVAFAEQSPLAVLPGEGATILRPEIAGIIRAAFDPVMPLADRDPSHALRLFARLGGTG